MKHPLGTSRLLAITCLLWLAVRFLPAPTRPPPLADAVFTSIGAAPSARAGRLLISGLPDPQADLLGLHRYPSWRAATHRLQSRVEEANEDLAALAIRISSRVETFPNGTAGLRAAGRVAIFHGGAAAHLSALAVAGRDRPWEVLSQVRQSLALRLESPGRLDDLGESAERQAMARLHREIDESLLAAERVAAEAVEQFRREAAAIPGEAAGPFRRRGPGRILEIVLAALLGGLLREATQTARGRSQPRAALFLAPVLATGTVLLLEGSRLLPVYPLEGVSRLFLPLSLALGIATGPLLEALARRGRSPDPAPTPPPSEARPTPTASPPAAAGTGETPPASAGRAEPARLPFFPRRR